jgi:hypothetical protein
LIGESAPWRDSGDIISYFYETLDGAWVDRVPSVFFQSKPSQIQDCLRKLAQKQFLLIDSLPFPMPFTPKFRNHKK